MAKRTDKLATLFHKGSKGSIYTWNIWTEGAEIVTEYGQIDGKKQIARKIAKPKNVGRANETSANEQAKLQATSMWTKKKERKYRETLDDAEENEVFLPQLAADFEKRRGKKKNGHSYPCDIQPKLDGVRCLAYWIDGDVRLMSRGGKTYNCPHISKELSEVLPKNHVLDGELYIHGETFQTITSWVKKFRPETENVKFHAYDYVDLDSRDLTWEERWTNLDAFFEQSSYKTIIETPTLTCENEEEVIAQTAEFVEEGYEGSIVRMYEDSAYKFGFRSKALLKVKSFFDEEYEVVGFHTGVGKFANCPIWECTSPNGNFNTICKGTLVQRGEQLKNADSYIGQMLKVKFFEKTDDGLPRFPVGIGFRMTEDM